jgi:hypothetical protein
MIALSSLLSQSAPRALHGKVIRRYNLSERLTFSTGQADKRELVPSNAANRPKCADKIQLMTMEVAGMPLNRDDVTVV